MVMQTDITGRCGGDVPERRFDVAHPRNGAVIPTTTLWPCGYRYRKRPGLWKDFGLWRKKAAKCSPFGSFDDVIVVVVVVVAEREREREREIEG